NFYPVRDTISENRLFFNRIVVVFFFIAVLMLGLMSRLIYLQIVGHQHYMLMAKNNRIKISPIPPTRGIIYDRKGRVLAQNLPSYSLELIPEQIKNLDQTLSDLQKLLDIPDEIINEFKKQRKRHKRFDSIPLLLSLTDEEIAKFSAARPFFPGVDIHAILVRYYPYGFLTSHVVGYVGRINERELKTLAENQYSGTFYIGKVGIEMAYETQLHGQAGYSEVETNAQGRGINILNKVDPIAGSDLYLNLDIDLQKTAYDSLTGYNGALVAIEIKTGGVLAFVSRPSFDPNPFINGISSKAYDDLQNSPDKPLFNRALRGLYPPGSTVKPFIGLAGLEYKAIDFKRKMYCPGYYQLPNAAHKFRDWTKWGHGSVNLNDAITESCDVYFYNLALLLGIAKMHDFLQQFGFGEKTGIDLVGEKSGLFPSPHWKKTTKKMTWMPGDSVITGIGQGYTQITPIQLARATATLANYGKVITPYLVNRLVNSQQVTAGPLQLNSFIPLKEKNVDDVISAMVNVVHSAHGTAKGIGKGLTYQIAGKTGTAQVFTVKQNEHYNKNALDIRLHDHALFISFAPANAPKIAVAVVVENGGHGGTTAAPMAAKVIAEYLAQDANHENGTP
ncbi:MAG: penicillin-binding protein 2, partial [Pseudomonadota bacterium]